MTKNFHERIENFVDKIEKRPIIVRNHQPPVQNFRAPVDPTLMKGEAKIRMSSYFTEKERIDKNIVAAKDEF